MMDINTGFDGVVFQPVRRGLLPRKRPVRHSLGEGGSAKSEEAPHHPSITTIPARPPLAIMTNKSGQGAPPPPKLRTK